MPSSQLKRRSTHHTHRSCCLKQQTTCTPATSGKVTIHAPTDACKDARTFQETKHLRRITTIEVQNSSKLQQNNTERHEDDETTCNAASVVSAHKATAVCSVRVTARSGRVDKGKGGNVNEGKQRRSRKSLHQTLMRNY